ncbi:hypothetical protein CAL36_15395 [Enterobacter kobei]|nr:hypothetical protein CAL36_15395 [Enterobacter kobei]
MEGYGVFFIVNVENAQRLNFLQLKVMPVNPSLPESPNGSSFKKYVELGASFLVFLRLVLIFMLW